MNYQKTQFETDFFPLIQYKNYNFNEGVIRETADFLDEDHLGVLTRFKAGFEKHGDVFPSDHSTEEVEKFYRESKDELCRQMWAAAWEKHHRSVIDKVTLSCYPGCHVLDYGGGVGWNSIILKKTGINVSYLDIEGILTDFSGFRFEARGLDIPIYHPDNLPCDHFDVVFAFAVFEHLTDPLDGLNRLRETLKKFGHLFLWNGFKDRSNKMHVGASCGSYFHKKAEEMGFSIKYRDKTNTEMVLRRER